MKMIFHRKRHRIKSNKTTSLCLLIILDWHRYEWEELFRMEWEWE